MSVHYIEKCVKCDAVIAQCRCPEKDKAVRYGLCAACKAGIPTTACNGAMEPAPCPDCAAKNAEIARLTAVATAHGCYAAWDEATEDAKRFASERDTYLGVLKSAHGALADAATVPVPGGYTDDLAPAIRQLTRERDAARAEVEAAIRWAYDQCGDTCTEGDIAAYRASRKGR